MSVLCCCQRAPGLYLHAFDDGVVVYDESDGSLHALNPVAGEALGHLMHHHRLCDAELARLMLLEEPEATELEQVRDLMHGLVSLGFAELSPT